MTTFYPQNSLAREVIQVYNSLTWFLTKMIQKAIPEKYPPSLSPSTPFPLSPLIGNHFDLSLVYLSGFLVSADTHKKRKYIFLFSLKGDSIIHTPLRTGIQSLKKLTESSSGLIFGWSRIHLLPGSLLAI